MMQISFALPHINSPTTSSVERERVLMVLKNAVSQLQKLHGASRAASVSPPSGAVNGSGRKTRFTFNLPTFFNPRSTQTIDDKALHILMEALTQINIIFLEYHPNIPKLYDSGVFYARTQIWDPIPALYARGYGDCKSLTAAMVSQRRKDGKEAYPVFRWVRANNPLKKGETNYHILVQNHRGLFEDPSKVLGMGRDALY